MIQLAKMVYKLLMFSKLFLFTKAIVGQGLLEQELRNQQEILINDTIDSDGIYNTNIFKFTFI